MKKIYFTSLCLLTAIVISSCVSSLYPISDNENDRIFREELLGHWADKDMKTQVIMNKADHNNYKVTIIERKNNEVRGRKIPYSDTSYYSGFLIRLNSLYFFDCTPDTDHPQFDCLGEETKSGLLPIHFIYKITSIEKDQLIIAGINLDSMQNFINIYPNGIKHEKLSKDHIMLTADAARLQKNMLTNKEAAFVFSEINILNRIK